MTSDSGFAESSRNRSQDPLVVTAVGKASSGKTSILRTLSEDDGFGTVAPEPVHMPREDYRSLVKHRRTVIRLFDTPGFEHSGEILERLADPTAGGLLREIIDQARQLAGDGYSPDLIAWTQVEKSDVVFLVVDCRQDTDPHYEKDLHLLSKCGKPPIVLLNRVADKDGKDFAEKWKACLHSHGLFSIVPYDAWKRNCENEIDLFGKIAATDIDRRHAKEVQVLADDRGKKEKKRIEHAIGIVANLLLNVATYQRSTVLDSDAPAADRKRTEKELEGALVNEIFDEWYRAERSILELWNLKPHLLEPGDDSEAPDEAGTTPRNPGNMTRNAGKGVAGGAAAGASIGAIVSLFTGGADLGMSIALGAAIGSFLGGTSGIALTERRGRLIAQVKRPFLGYVLKRQVELTGKVRRRGKAIEQNRIQFNATVPELQDEQVLGILESVRDHEQWSLIERNESELSDREKRERDDKLKEIMDALRRLVEDA